MSDEFIESGTANAPAKKGAKTALFDLSLDLKLNIINRQDYVSHHTPHMKRCINLTLHPKPLEKLQSGCMSHASPAPSQRKNCRSTSRRVAVCHTSHVIRHTSHVTRHTQHATRHTSHATRHTPHVTRHTSHVKRHTSHVTRHTSPA